MFVWIGFALYMNTSSGCSLGLMTAIDKQQHESKHIGTESNWTPFCRKCFQIHFRQRCVLVKILLTFLRMKPICIKISIGSGNGLVPIGANQWWANGGFSSLTHDPTSTLCLSTSTENQVWPIRFDNGLVLFCFVRFGWVFVFPTVLVDSHLRPVIACIWLLSIH